MPKTTINRFGLYGTTVIVIASVLMFVLHHFAIKNNFIFPDTSIKISHQAIYLFLVPLSILGFLFVYWRYTKDHTAAGRNYFVVMFVKIFSSATFLYPGVVARKQFMYEMVINFMPVFFILLFIETFLLVRLLNQPLSEKSKNDENQ